MRLKYHSSASIPLTEEGGCEAEVGLSKDEDTLTEQNEIEALVGRIMDCKKILSDA